MQIMRIRVLCLALLGMLAASCANMGQITDVMLPAALSKQGLKTLAYETTPEYGFKVGAADGVEAGKAGIIENVDIQFSEFSRCFGIDDNGKEVSGYLIAVVDSTFLCNYHGGRCNGEYDPENSLIIVTYEAFNRKGVMPLLKHEWAHAYGILRSDHENLDEIEKCTVY